MISRFAEKPSQILIPLLVASFCLTALGLGVAGTAVARTSGDAAFVNRAGLVRGGIQRAAKLELAGIPSMDSLDVALGTLESLKADAGGRLDAGYEPLAAAMARLRGAMVDVRGGDVQARAALVRASEDAWDLSNDLVSALEASARSKRGLFVWGLLFMAAGVVCTR